MSEQTTAAAAAAPPTAEVIELPNEGDAAFSALMDALAPAAFREPTGEGGAPLAPATAGDGQPAAAGQGAPAAAGQPEAPAAGGAGVTGVAPAGTADPASTGAGTGAGADAVGAGSAVGDVDALSIAPKWGELSTAVEDAALEQFKEEAFDEVKEEYEKYFDALDLHPRQLIGQTVPRIGAEGEETLRDSADAEEWQAAVKQILTAEVRDRATRLLDDAAPGIAVVHQSIELFQNNIDLIPGTKQFDRELADRFATLAKPYELRVEGDLRGYSIPTQPLINQIRTQLAAERAAKPASAATAAAPPAPGAAPAVARASAQAEPPQAGIPSKAGSGAESEDFSTLFGTIGLPNLRI